MHKATYLQNCRDIAERNGVSFIEENHMNNDEESQPSIHVRLVPVRMLCAAFSGQEVEVDKPVFDSSISDFDGFPCRSKSGHAFRLSFAVFTNASLGRIRSFSTTVSDRGYYVNAIEDYFIGSLWCVRPECYS